jgi:hypothetical protein
MYSIRNDYNIKLLEESLSDENIQISKYKENFPSSKDILDGNDGEIFTLNFK